MKVILLLSAFIRGGHFNNRIKFGARFTTEFKTEFCPPLAFIAETYAEKPKTVGQFPQITLKSFPIKRDFFNLKENSFSPNLVISGV